ncbi:Transposon TX1 uncharacterized protein [Nymphaea thermarum]|nr:Transposon TX1 uncharacterized protein [Nymphaea thermarum]
MLVNVANRVGNYEYASNSEWDEVSQRLKVWNRLHFGNIGLRIQSLYGELDRLSKSIEDGHLADIAKEVEVRHDLQRALEWEKVLWKDKAMSHWLRNGDRNTKYFQSVAMNRERKNRITKLMIGDEMVEGDDNINEATTLYFETFMSSDFANGELFEHMVQGNTVSYMDNQFLEAPVTKQEIKDVVYSLDRDNAVGPDGFPNYFFQDMWAVVGDDTCKVITSFFNSDHGLVNKIAWTIKDGQSALFWLDKWGDVLLKNCIQANDYDTVSKDFHLNVAMARNKYLQQSINIPLAMTQVSEITLTDNRDSLGWKSDPNMKLSSTMFYEALRHKANKEPWLEDVGILDKLYVITLIIKSKRIMVGCLQDSDANIKGALSLEACYGVDDAEFNILKWGETVRSTSFIPLAIYSNNKGWIKRLKSIIEGRRNWPEK